jgi:hypothetical protein
MASSTSLPILGSLARDWICAQRASRHPEDVGGEVFVLVLGVGPLVVTGTGDESGVVFVEGVGDVFEEDQAEDDVLVFRRVHVVAQLVGGEPEFRFEANVGAGFGFPCCFGHRAPVGFFLEFAHAEVTQERISGREC